MPQSHKYVRYRYLESVLSKFLHSPDRIAAYIGTEFAQKAVDPTQKGVYLPMDSYSDPPESLFGDPVGKGVELRSNENTNSSVLGPTSVTTTRIRLDGCDTRFAWPRSCLAR